MDISVIIVNYNTSRVFKNCLNSIWKYKNDYQLEVIVVDNNSFDDSVVMIRKDFPEVKLLINHENQGFARANNLAARIADSEILFFLNPDTLIQENIFQKIIEIFEANPRVGIVAPQLVVPDSSPQPWAYGKEEGLWQLVKNKFKNNLPTYQLTNLLTKADWVSGAALIVRRDVFEKVGGFDENFFMYFEDRDLCYRVRQLGYKIIVLPEIKVVHFGGKSLTKNKERKKLYYQSQSYYWRKHYGLAVSLLLRLIRWPYKFYILNIQK